MIIASVPGPLCYSVYNMRHWNMYNDYSQALFVTVFKNMHVQMMKALLEPWLLTLLAGAHLLQAFSLLLWTPVAEDIIIEIFRPALSLPL